MTRVLMTLDAVGGVWRYAMDLGRQARAAGVELAFAGLGPQPGAAQRAEALALGSLDWGTAPLDWMAPGPEALSAVPGWIDGLARQRGADLLHLNMPTQALDLRCGLPVVTVSHSCLATWFAAVEGTTPPAALDWQVALTRRGLAAADAVVAPSAAHAAALARVYGCAGIRVVPNASDSPLAEGSEGAGVVAAGRWWDRGKNGAALDAAAGRRLVPVTMAGALAGPDGSHFQPRHAGCPGPLPHAQLCALVTGARLFVSPSLYEPFGLAALEAARASRPLLLADIPTYRELWDGAAAFFDPRDPEALAQAIGGLAADSARRRQLGQAARQRAVRYSTRAQGEAMLTVWGGVLPAVLRRLETL